MEHSWEELPEDNLSPEMREQLLALQQQLDSFRTRLQQCREGDKAFIQGMQVFRQYLAGLYANDTDSALYQAFEKTDYFLRHREQFAHFEHHDVRASEARESLAVKNKDYRQSSRFVDLCISASSRHTYEQTREECKLIDFSLCNTLVMVGCGPLPKTMMFIRENAGRPNINITGLDYEETATAIAEDLLISLGIENVYTHSAKGEEYDYRETDVIHVANFVSPKRVVLERIAQTMKNHAQIIIRTPASFGKLLYEDILPNIPPRLTLQKSTPVNPYFLYKGLLLTKEESDI